MISQTLQYLVYKDRVHVLDSPSYEQSSFHFSRVPPSEWSPSRRAYRLTGRNRSILKRSERPLTTGLTTYGKGMSLLLQCYQTLVTLIQPTYMLAALEIIYGRHHPVNPNIHAVHRQRVVYMVRMRLVLYIWEDRHALLLTYLSHHRPLPLKALGKPPPTNPQPSNRATEMKPVSCLFHGSSPRYFVLPSTWIPDISDSFKSLRLPRPESLSWMSTS